MKKNRNFKYILLLNCFFLTGLININCHNNCEFKNRRNLKKLKSIISGDIEKINIYSEENIKGFQMLCLISIENEKIIKSFKNLVISNTRISSYDVGRFNKDSYVTLISKRKTYTFNVMYKTWDTLFKNDVAHFSFFKNPHFDVKNFFNEIDPGAVISRRFKEDTGCFYIENNSLIHFFENLNLLQKKGISIKCKKINRFHQVIK